MNKYELSHLSDRELLRDLAALVARERTTTAALLAHIAEVDERRLYLPAAAERLPQPELPTGIEAIPAPALPTPLQVTIGQSTRDKLRYAQALLGHQLPVGDVAEVLDRALAALIGRLEKK